MKEVQIDAHFSNYQSGFSFARKNISTVFFERITIFLELFDIN
jgi:hypothetical protein